MTRYKVLREFKLDDVFIVDMQNIYRMADEIVWLREQLAEKTNSYRSSVIAAEAETKQWKEFFYAERHRAERAERVVEAAKAYLTEWDSDSYESVAHAALLDAVRALDAEAQP